MTKLTNISRDSIIDAAIADRFGEKQEELIAKRAKLAMKVYDTVVTKEEQKLLAKVYRVWLRTADCLRANAGGWIIELRLEEPLPTKWSWHETINLTDPALIEEVRACANEMQDLRDAKDNAHRLLGTLLREAKTFAQLKAAWPDGKAYWEPVWIAATDKVALPAVQVAEVNKAFGLPKEAA